MGAIKLRIFAGDGFSSGGTPRRETWRLREAYDKLLADGISTAGTRSCYATLLRKWEALTDNPRLESIDVDVVRSFGRELQRQLAGETAAKYLRHLRAILRRCGPATDGNPLGAEILTRSPHVEMPKRRHTVPRVATAAEVDAVFRACEHATWPKVAGVATQNLWRAAILSLWTLGPRCWDLWATRPRDRYGTGWRWERVDLVNATIAFDQVKTGHETKLPLSPTLVRYLTVIQSDRYSVFPATLARGSLYRQWTAIKAAARVDPALEFHDLRRSAQTNWDAIHFGLGDFILGHAASDVGGRHYRNFGALAAESIGRYPEIPAAAELGRQAKRQLTLF